jgi:hypothetical protein
MKRYVCGIVVLFLSVGSFYSMDRGFFDCTLDENLAVMRAQRLNDFSMRVKRKRDREVVEQQARSKIERNQLTLDVITGGIIGLTIGGIILYFVSTLIPENSDVQNKEEIKEQKEESS